MPEELPPNPPAANDLQFDQVEYEASAARGATCAACQQPIRDVYYEVNGQPLCDSCREVLEKSLVGGSRARRFVRALMFGAGAAALGTAIYYGIARATNMEFSLIAILVGWMVGKAVHKGSDGRGGWFYQGLAVFLTYNAIVLTYIPMMLQFAAEHKAADREKAAAVKGQQPGVEKGKAVQDAPAAEQPKPEDTEPLPRPSPVEIVLALIFLVGLAYAIPFLAGFQNIIGLLIIGFGLYQAWLLNRRVPLVIAGPYQLGAAPPSSEAAGDVEPGP